jgi:hypothetical protein
MKRLFIIFTFSFFILNFFVPSLSFGAKKALLVGINDYQNLPFSLPGRGLISDLKGSLNDVKAMKEILIKRYGFPPDNVKVLTDRNAKRKNIIRAFNEWLIGGSREGDLVLFYFSGHGSQVRDQNGDETDGLDEVLCPYDVVPAGGRNIILDDELGDMLRRLGGREVVVIIDACHSGTLTRGIRGEVMSVLESTPCSQARYIPIINYRPSGISRSLPLQDDRPEDYLFMAASKEDQIAMETNKPGVFYGGFTYGLVEGLKTLRNPTYQDVFKYANKVVKDRLRLPQDPQIEPDRRDIVLWPVFKQRPSKPEQVVSTKPTTEVVEESQIATSPIPSPIAEEPTPPETPIVITPQPPPEIRGRNVLVKIEPFGTNADVENLKSRLERLPYVEIVENDLFDRLIRGEVKDSKYQVRLLNMIGDVVRVPPQESLDSLVNAIAPHLEYAYVVKQLAYISNPKPPFKVNVWVTDEKRRDFRLGERIVFNFESERDCYLLLLNLDSKGNSHVIFPNRFYRNNFIQGGRALKIPDEQMRKKNFELMFGKPAGEEVVKAIATTKPLDLRGLDLEKFGELFQTISRSVTRSLVRDIFTTLSEGQFEWSEDTVVIRSHGVRRP